MEEAPNQPQAQIISSQTLSCGAQAYGWRGLGDSGIREVDITQLEGARLDVEMQLVSIRSSSLKPDTKRLSERVSYSS